MKGILKGHVKIWKNGTLYSEGHNSIEVDLRQYFVDEMNSPVDRAIDNLFTIMGQTGSQATGQDGILVVDDNLGGDPGLTMETVYNGGQNWTGTYTNTTGSDQTIYSFRIGHNFLSGGTFDHVYASHLPGAGILLNDQDSVVMVWQLNFEPAA